MPLLTVTPHTHTTYSVLKRFHWHICVHGNIHTHPGARSVYRRVRVWQQLPGTANTCSPGSGMWGGPPLTNNCSAPSAHNDPTEKCSPQPLSRGVFIQFRNLQSQSHVPKILLEKTWRSLGPDLCANEARVHPYGVSWETEWPVSSTVQNSPRMSV